MGAVSRWRSSTGWAVALLLTAGSAVAQTALEAAPGEARHPSVVRALGLTAVEYGQQFVVTCEEGDPSPFFYPGPGCSQVEGMSFDIHRDNWSSNYLNYDDPQDPSNAGLLTRQGYISLQLADPTAYKALALLKAYEATGRAAFLQRFRHAFLQQILDKQLPSTALGLGAVQTFQASYFPDPLQDVTLDATGAFANSATLAGGVDGVLGTADDVLTWRWNGHAGFNFAALAEVLATYAQLTGDTHVLPAIERAGRFLLRLERRTPTGEPEGSWAYGVAPANGFPNRMTTGIIGVTLLKLSSLGVAARGRRLPGRRPACGHLAAAAASCRSRPGLHRCRAPAPHRGGRAGRGHRRGGRAAGPHDDALMVLLGGPPLRGGLACAGRHCQPVGHGKPPVALVRHLQRRGPAAAGPGHRKRPLHPRRHAARRLARRQDGRGPAR
ncbi:hypothetical protein ACLESO_06265 [Pyxidicoccus sp. 3LG]